jgi:Rrf2 family protein
MRGFDAKTRYALSAALDLAEHRQGQKPVKIREIAARTGIPPKYLVHILLQLKRRALVNSTRGARGGYWLVRPPDLVSAAEVINAVATGDRGGPPHAVEARHEGIIGRLYQQADRRRREYLSQTTLAQLLEGKAGT